jgi:hypothetical protein
MSNKDISRESIKIVQWLIIRLATCPTFFSNLVVLEKIVGYEFIVLFLLDYYPHAHEAKT